MWLRLKLMLFVISQRVCEESFVPFVENYSECPNFSLIGVIYVWNNHLVLWKWCSLSILMLTDISKNIIKGCFTMCIYMKTCFNVNSFCLVFFLVLFQSIKYCEKNWFTLSILYIIKNCWCFFSVFQIMWKELIYIIYFVYYQELLMFIFIFTLVE